MVMTGVGPTGYGRKFALLAKAHRNLNHFDYFWAQPFAWSLSLCRSRVMPESFVPSTTCRQKHGGLLGQCDVHQVACKDVAHAKVNFINGWLAYPMKNLRYPAHLLGDERGLAPDSLSDDPRTSKDGWEQLEPQVAQIVAGQTSAAPSIAQPFPLFEAACIRLVSVVERAQIHELPEQVQEPAHGFESGIIMQKQGGRGDREIKFERDLTKQNGTEPNRTDQTRPDQIEILDNCRSQISIL